MLVELSKKTFVGTVGYHILGNHSIGPVLLPQLKAIDFPNHIFVDELNWGPVAVVQQFQAEAVPYQRVILLCAIERPDRGIGDITVFQWKGGLPDTDQIQACMGDAATGVISVENLLVIGEYFEVWGEEVFLVDVEPGPEQAGEQLSPAMEKKIPEILDQVTRLALYGLDNSQESSLLFGNTIFTDG